MNKYQKAFNTLSKFNAGLLQNVEYTVELEPIREADRILLELIDKETPYKPTDIEHYDENISFGKCKCSFLTDNYEERCDRCNQLLDWSDCNE